MKIYGSAVERGYADALLQPEALRPVTIICFNPE